jgi:hypothetical protein
MISLDVYTIQSSFLSGGISKKNILVGAIAIYPDQID